MEDSAGKEALTDESGQGIAPPFDIEPINIFFCQNSKQVKIEEGENGQCLCPEEKLWRTVLSYVIIEEIRRKKNILYIRNRDYINWLYLLCDLGRVDRQMIKQVLNSVFSNDLAKVKKLKRTARPVVKLPQPPRMRQTEGCVAFQIKTEGFFWRF